MSWDEETTMTEKVKSKTKEEPSKGQDARLDRELADTFPASDPPSATEPVANLGAPDHRDAKAK